MNAILVRELSRRNVDIAMEEGDIEDDNNMDSSNCNAEGFHQEEKVNIATEETQKVGCLRVIVILVILVVAASVSFAVYWSTHQSQQAEFETHATETCEKVVRSFQAGAMRRLGAISSLATSISSNAAAQGQQWPYVKVPDFEEQLTITLGLAAVMSISLLPVVADQDLDSWNSFSVENQDWLKEGLAYQIATSKGHLETSEDVTNLESVMGKIPNNAIRDQVFQLTEDGFMNATSNSTSETFMPWWQFAPVFPVSSLVNYDTLTNPSRKYQLKSVIEKQIPSVSEAWDYSDTENALTYGKSAVLNLFLKHWQSGGQRYQAGPVSDLYFPVMDRSHAVGSSSHSPKVAAVLTAYIYWQVYFENVLPPSGDVVVVVLENICGKKDEAHAHEHMYNHQQQFTYVIRGEEAAYVGMGDLHNPTFDYLEETTSFHAFLNSGEISEDLMEGQCLYRLRAYPTEEMKETYQTNEPLYFMVVVLSTFVVTSFIFLLYDHYVSRRHQLVLRKAIRSTRVVQNLFPENVRDRLFDESGTHGSIDNQTKSRLRALRDGSSSDNRTANTSMEDERVGIVADLYENCTVLFADIAGFTKWSANRDPKQVFQLLETIYAVFDKLARRRGVFKVETIGDCYLAITGVPLAQQAHALIMAKFASDAITNMDKVIYTCLVEALGEDTAQLQLRVGLHSGSVTAGVLRGERARFQLFGDTVNTASRMESTGSAGQIQCSEETAQLLRKAGKGPWLTSRKGGVVAKGKGALQTYYVQPKKAAPAGSVCSGLLSDESGDTKA